MGAKPFTVVTELQMIKEILNNKEHNFSKIKDEDYFKKLLGDGILVAEGEKWSKLRKLADHAFHGNCLKVKNKKSLLICFQEHYIWICMFLFTSAPSHEVYTYILKFFYVK